MTDRLDFGTSLLPGEPGIVLERKQLIIGTAHIANAALRAGHPVKWNPSLEKFETV
jgi:hypothetical protein